MINIQDYRNNIKSKINLLFRLMLLFFTIGLIVFIYGYITLKSNDLGTFTSLILVFLVPIELVLFLLICNNLIILLDTYRFF